MKILESEKQILYKEENVKQKNKLIINEYYSLKKLLNCELSNNL